MPDLVGVEVCIPHEISMERVDIAGERASQLDGAIPLCPHMGCAFKCCQFQQTGPIVLFPGEIEARASHNWGFWGMGAFVG
jgi:hypothetical protein